ncbi:MAG: hypothetical protein V4670_00585 [Bacteroidota bacterium]
MKKSILILFLLVQFFCFGQDENKATIIFSDGTTIEGIGEIKRNKILFKVDPKDDFSVWNYDMAKGIILYKDEDLEKHEYIKPDKYSEPFLMQLVDEGFVNLYKKAHAGLAIKYPDSPQMAVKIHLPKQLSNNLPNHDMSLGGIPYIDKNKSETYYVKKQNEEIATDITFSFKNRALKYFSDCEIVIKKINDKTFSKNNIAELVNYYNNYCDGEEN